MNISAMGGGAPIRRVGVVATAVTLVFVAACSPTVPATKVAPGTGPATSTTTKKAKSTKIALVSTKTATFKDLVAYQDGIQVEVIKIKLTKLSATGSSSAKLKKGTPVQILSVRIKNGSKKRLDADAATGTMTYGPDGDEAPTAFDDGVKSMSGTILPGKAKTGTYGFSVPSKYLGDATLEFQFDFEHDSAIFSGALE